MREKDEEFSKTLNQRVNHYFKTENRTKHANLEMVIKTIMMYSLFLVPYFFIYAVSNPYLAISLYALMGVGMAGLGLSVMHDANHGSYSNKKWINRLLGYTLNVIGGNATNWKIQHNVFHHTYTNIDSHDEDVRPRFIMRFSPHAKRQWFHRFQYIYAWILYGFMTVSWILFKDVVQLMSYQKTGILKKHADTRSAWMWLICTKSIYYTYIVVIPWVFTPLVFWQALLGFFAMHYVAGFILAIVFQPAHVMEMTEFPMANSNDHIEENWTVHQLKTTCNFAMKSKWLSWYVGGLNFQVEHHLFPHICHVHYPAISRIVQQTASEYSIPYHSISTFWGALVTHGRMLYKLGRPTV
ncbi:acyl-CoA desaturase [Marinoscillum sp. MHG1-6]|uniref:fatty acid desaturase family protein n=1 Tax=Marinoscillum sp. MHG1-6 TaxID=2959627 RepID=UPI002157D1AD|nr:acyl-CoA desaturase [Marinoscillum sp. MHG1-6]